MPYRYNSCPHCNQKIIFIIEKDDIDDSLYPAPVYIHHKHKSCKNISTFYVDSLLQVSYKELEKKKSKTKKKPKIIKTLGIKEIRKDTKAIAEFLKML